MIILDVEIRRAILGRGEAPIEGIDYCHGWKDYAGMGVACVCTFDIVNKLSRVFLEDNRDELIAYVEGRVTAGFNTRRFDLPLLEEHGWLPQKFVLQGSHYDILEQIWIALGLNPDRFVPATHGGWSLDAVCGSTLGVVKSGNGALAPHWWQRKRFGRVADYCARDSWLEGQLLLHILAKKPVSNGRQTLDVHVPEDLWRA